MKRLIALTAIAFLACGLATARAGHGFWSVGINLGYPGYYYRPYPCYGYYYRPYPVYVAPAPVIVESAPVYQLPAPTPVYARPVPLTTTTASQGDSVQQQEIGRHLEMLRSSDERARADSVMQLGRLRAPQAIDPLAATLAGDPSPTVRESAARALGLIGSPQALPALQRAAQMDADREVRHSAQFALEVIQTKG
jgi:hypothetical protein